MSLETLKKFLYHCDLRKTKQIILIHLSDRNSNEEQMIREISGLTGIKTSVANAGDVYELRKDPF
jgi:ribonuclease BN (tRNA processing enzyme)